MPKVTIDGQEVEVAAGSTVLQACQAAGVEIPVFCYHERLEIAGNCRMCLVEVEKQRKPIASCAFPINDGMVVHTKSPLVKKARQGTLEFLLINHPLDCPICDQGGECDLQDETMAYGLDRSRYKENRRSVKDKYVGPLVETWMNRCIHCTRCVRFMTEVAGVEELGACGRGEDTEITPYIEKALSSELSGNIIDLCPVGALTSKPYAYKARSWELKKIESIDVFDAVGSNIRVDTRGAEVMRIMPLLNEDVNEEWLSDKARFSYDGLSKQRLDKPYIKKNGKLTACSWDEALDAVAQKLKDTLPNKIAALAGDFADAESMVALKDLMTALEVSHLDCRQDGSKLVGAARGHYLFNTTIAGIDEADCCLIIGSNPRIEAPIINARLRKRYLAGNMKFGLIGKQADLTYPVQYLSDSAAAIKELAAGKGDFASLLEKAERPMIIVGSGVLARNDCDDVLTVIHEIANKYGCIKDGWNGFNVLHCAASRVAGHDLGFLPQGDGWGAMRIAQEVRRGNIDVVYLLGADELPFEKLDNTFVVYQGHHGDRGAHMADVILPGAAYTEKSGTYVNTEGRVQRGQLALLPPGDAKEDWKIIRALSDKIGKSLPYGTLSEVRARLVEVNSVFGAVDTIAESVWQDWQGSGDDLSNLKFESAIDNYYMTDPISRSSSTMAKCIDEIVNGNIPRECANA
jgi:NADH-quinone oxidoreductase subunit G